MTNANKGNGYFRKGDRVKLSAEGLAASLAPKTRWNAKTRGTLIRVRDFGPNLASLTVLIDGRRTTGTYHSAFWDHAFARKAAKRSLPRCSQCGQDVTAPACGPTHALLAAEEANR